MHAPPVAAVLAVVAAAGLAGLPVAAERERARTVIAAGTLIDGRGAVLRDTRIVVEGSRIVAIDPSAGPVDIDLGARTVMPGWIDTHVHLSWYLDERGRAVNGGPTPEEAARQVAKNAEATLRAGFTTVESVGAAVDGPVRDAIAQGALPGPRILGSLGQISGIGADQTALRALVRRASGGGADVIKVIATAGLGGDPYKAISEAQARAVCDEATAAGLRSVVHAVYDAGAQAAARAGCTSIEHGTFVSDRTLRLMAERGTWFDPNLLVWHNYIENRAAFGMTEESIAAMREAIGRTAEVLRRARALGVRIAFGTDAVAGAHGRNAEEFIYRVREAREKPSDVLISATSAAAASLGLGSRLGSVAAGYEADLVATDGNPLDDITAVRRVVFVMQAGRSTRRTPGPEQE